MINNSKSLLQKNLIFNLYPFLFIFIATILATSAYADNIFRASCKQRGGTQICTQDGLTPINPTFYWLNGPEFPGTSTVDVYTKKIQAANAAALSYTDCVNGIACFDYRPIPGACATPVAMGVWNGSLQQIQLYIQAGGGLSQACAWDSYRNGQLYHAAECHNCWSLAIKTCPTGWSASTSDTPNGLPGYCYKIKSNMPPKLNGPASCEVTTRHPITLASGNKYKREVDYQSQDQWPVSFTRHYNSEGTFRNLDVGKNWIFEYDRSLYIDYLGFVYVKRHDGKMFTYQYDSALQKYKTDSDTSYKLTEIKDTNDSRLGWTFDNTNDNSIETYDAQGKLLSITNPTGLTISLDYDVATNNGGDGNSATLDRIVDSSGRQYLIEYSPTIPGRIIGYLDSAGGHYSLTYNAEGNLVSLTYPDGTFKTYHYENTFWKQALTGITDESGYRHLTWTYGSNQSDSKNFGKAISGELAGGVEKETISINQSRDNGGFVATVTNSLGATRTYTFLDIAGVKRLTSQSQPAGSGCAAAASALTYDANGNVASRVDFNGNKTTYVYDLSRNLETSRTEGLTTAGAATTATRTITTAWHTTWRLPLVISEYSGSTGTGTPLKRTTNGYDSKGNVTSYTEEDPVRSLSRTTTTTYTYSTAVPGLVLEKEVDGPRPTDIDRTIYTYYPHDATCVASTATPLVDPLTSTSPTNLGCRGQLLSVLRPVGITTYDRYNHHGQVEQLTDPNGVVTEFTYDLRQRLTSETTGTESTQFTYDNAGLLVQTKFPDNSELNYVYDNAHRLTEISNTTGDKVVYTLDSEGNRIQEEMYDAYGSIAKSLTRQFDALNRAQQVTGE